ncbi:MAG: hypothetical protein AAGK01_12060, partial [Pseudomonadota bacterium]
SISRSVRPRAGTEPANGTEMVPSGPTSRSGWQDRSDPAKLKDPVIYSFDLKDPAVYFLAQQFHMQDGDLVYITNSPIAELQRFVGIVSQTILPAATVTTVIDQATNTN